MFNNLFRQTQVIIPACRLYNCQTARLATKNTSLLNIHRAVPRRRASTMGFKLYKLDASPPARAVMMTLEALNVKDVELIDVNLMAGDHMKEEYLKLNPQHTVPTLVDNGFAIWDSHAIASYLVTKYAKDDALYPTDPKKRVFVDQKLHFDSGILFPAVRGAVFAVFYRGETSLKQENLDKIADAYDLAERQFTNTWAAGDQLTIADICCSASMSSLNEVLPIDAEKYPNITAWLARVSKQDFYKKANVPGCQQLGGFLKLKLA